MASPFRMFRKNQKVMMAVLTVLAMFAFVFLGQFSRFSESTSASQNPDVFTWKYGSVRKSDIQNREFYRRFVNLFLFNGAKMAGVPDQMISSFTMDEQNIIEAILLNKKAEELGIVVSDKGVNDFIRQWTFDRVRPEQLALIIYSLSSDQRSISQAQLFDALRFELAALKMRQLFAPLMNRSTRTGAMFIGDPPAERWDYFCRLNRKVTAQMIPVTVDNFVSVVPEPTDTQLHTFFDQYKDVYAQPDSPVPGFKQPFRAQFQYFKADEEKLVADELPKVTDKEIKDYYDRYKDVFFKKQQLQDEPGKTDGKPADSKNTPKANDGKSGDMKPSDSKPGDATSDGSNAKPKTDGAKPDDSKKSNTPKQSSFVPATRSLDGELLALADTSDIQLAQAPKNNAPKSDAPKSDTAKTDAAKPDAPKPDAVKTSAPKSDAKPPAASTTDAQKSGAQPPAAPTKPDAAAGLPQRPVEYEPLSKVTDKIRNSIAAQKVEHNVDDAFNALRLQMDQYGRAMDVYHRDVTRGDTAAKPPAALDVAPLAKQYKLEAKETSKVSMEQMAEGSDLGKSHHLVAGSYNAVAFLQMAFAPNYPKYQPQETEDLEKNRYLWWKTADEPIKVPNLDDIKPEVVRAWKMIEARKSAQVKAEEVAAQANKLQKPLKEIFKAAQSTGLFTAGPFSWMSRRVSDPNAPPTLSEVSGVKEAGSDFMKAVFALQPGQAGVAPNQPLTVYYVVQIETEEPSLAELRKSFLTAMETPTASSIYALVAAQDKSSQLPAWIKEIESDLQYKLVPGQTVSAGRETD